IDFHRTLRIPDNSNDYPLPPSLGLFPLFNVRSFANSLPSKWVEEGGIFLPMYQREALWMNFRSAGTPYALKVGVGKINAVSGEEWKSGVLSEEKQDYLVCPQQPWLDGICAGEGRIRQFVAMPKESGYSVEAQLTGVDSGYGFQLEVIPKFDTNVRFQIEPRPQVWQNVVFELTKTGSELGRRCGETIFMISPELQRRRPATFAEAYSSLCQEEILRVRAEDWILVKTLTRKTLKFPFDKCLTLEGLQARICAKEGIPPDQQRLLFAGRELREDEILGDCGIQSGSTLFLVLRLRGGSEGVEEGFEGQMALAAGGTMKQKLYPDPYGPRHWDLARAEKLNVFVLDATVLPNLGLPAPSTPVDAEAYQRHGLPWFDLYDEGGAALGPSPALAGWQSVAKLDGEMNAEAAGEVAEQAKSAGVLYGQCAVCMAAGCNVRLAPCAHLLCTPCALHLGTR
ncbi:unnamed protein product, partial [Heterosigma akashiwo]